MYKQQAHINTKIRHLEQEMRYGLQEVTCIEDEERIRAFYEPKIAALREKKLNGLDEPELLLRPKRKKPRYG